MRVKVLEGRLFRRGEAGKIGKFRNATKRVSSNISTEITPLPKVPVEGLPDGVDCRNVNRCKLLNSITSIYGGEIGYFTFTLKNFGGVSI